MRFTRVFSLLAGLAVVAGCAGGGTTESAAIPAADGARALRSVTKLGSYAVDRSGTIVAGISSGGFMAVQMHVAYSSTFHGAAVYAGGPYYCAQDALATAENACMNAVTSTNLSQLESYTDSHASSGAIDSTANLNGQKAYLWSGTQDTTVKQSVMNDLKTYYAHYGVTSTYDNGYAAAHGWESPYGELACGTATTPYMIDCSGYDSENTWLSLFYGTLAAKNTGTLGGSLIQFDQTEFGSSAALMDSTGYVYVPAACAGGQTCRLVVALHGCLQTQASIGTKFITESGIDQWADTNKLIVLYPYAIANSNAGNPNGCWDWWGYGSANYALKSGPQMTAVKAMVDRVQGTGPTPTPSPSPAPTGSPAPTPTPTATPVPTPTPTPSPSPFCTTASNYAHVQAGRAHDSVGYALANGSNQNMGLDNVYYQTTLKQTGPNYYVIGCT